MNQKLPEFSAAIEEVSFFTLSGATVGATVGSIFGLYKRIPQKRILPTTTFRTAAFFATISALQNTLEITRNRRDTWNSLLAGGWTGFIFGHGLTRNYKYGLGLALNTAILNWALQSFSIPTIRSWILEAAETLNPVLLEKNTKPLKMRIDTLRAQIDSLEKK